MSKLFTLNYLISSYQAGKREVELFQHEVVDSENCTLNSKSIEFEPSLSSIDAILSFASQYEVLESKKTGIIELNLN